MYDRVPFEDRSPTANWPADFTAVESFALQLEADLPPGLYTVRSGMYEPLGKERIPVTDARGAPVTDLAITLGTVEIGAP